MARRKKSRRSSGFSQQKVFKLVRLAGLLAPAAAIALGAGNADQKVRMGIQAYTGYDMLNKKWVPASLLQGYGGLLGASIATYGIPKIVGMIRGI